MSFFIYEATNIISLYVVIVYGDRFMKRRIQSAFVFVLVAISLLSYFYNFRDLFPALIT